MQLMFHVKQILEQVLPVEGKKKSGFCRLR